VLRAHVDDHRLVFALAAETLLEIEVPPRAVWIRMLMSELNRLSSHLLWMATNGMDIGAVSMMIYGWRERETVQRFFEKVTGLRMNYNYIRIGGVAVDLPDGWKSDVEAILDALPARLGEYDDLLTGQPIFRQRTEGIGILSAEQAIALGTTGPLLRSTGVPWDLRRTMPYLNYDQVDFDVVVGTYGDCFDRYAIRLNEMRESMKIIRQIIDRMPAGDYRIQDKKVTPPPRARIDESMEALIHHFKIFTEGIKVPAGEVYVAVESPRGELGCYMVADGSAKPYRMHIRGPSFVNLQTLPPMLQGGLVADAIAVISSVDPVMGEVDRYPMPRLSTDMVERARDVIALYPQPRSALIPLLHLAQEQDGWLTEDAMAHVAELLEITPAEVYGTATFYDMFFTEPVGRYLVSVCTNIACLLNGGQELLEHAQTSLNVMPGTTSDDGVFTLEEVECVATCGEAPCLAVNCRYFGKVTPQRFDTLMDDLQAGRLADEVPPHGTLNRVRREITAWANAAATRAEAPAPPPSPAQGGTSAPSPAPTEKPTGSPEPQPASAGAASQDAPEHAGAVEESGEGTSETEQRGGNTGDKA
jgi:NADH-quinone oxidoreductase subunit D